MYQYINAVVIKMTNFCGKNKGYISSFTAVWGITVCAHHIYIFVRVCWTVIVFVGVEI